MPRIKIYGERNTNTNYLGKLIQLNLDTVEIPGVVPAQIMSLQKKLSGNERVRDLYFKFSFKHNLGWKHSQVRPMALLQKALVGQSNVCFISLTKNPYAWLLSLHRNPYHQYYHKKLDFETFLQIPWQTVWRDNCPKKLSSPMELWNTKNGSYLPLAEGNGLNLTTEGLLEDPQQVIEEISQHFNINKRSDIFRNYEKSTKDKRKNFSYYQDYYLNELWREQLSDEAIDIINHSIDSQLMAYFGYKLLP